MKELTSKRIEAKELQLNLDGEVYTLRPVKKSKVMVGMLAASSRSSGDDDLMSAMAAPAAMVRWFESCLSAEHHKSKKHPGHGKESVEGCQACRVIDRLGDDDDPLEIETVFEAANWVMSELSDRPTGQSNA